MRLISKPFGLKGLHLQSVENEASYTLKVHIEYQPFRRFCKQEQYFQNPYLDNLAELLEWSYGYKNTLNTNGRNKRRAPSAGALFPIETMVLLFLDNKWQLCYYCFEEHVFYKVPFEANNLQTLSLSDTDKVYVFFVAVFWRTIQKYGVRGFRYSLLDAGTIGRNIERIYRNINPTGRMRLDFGKTELQQLIPLKKGEEVLCTYVFDKKFNFAIESEKAKSLQFPVNISRESIPCVSTNMIRVLDVAERVLNNPHKCFELTGDPNESETIFKNIESRKSVNGFTDNSVEDTTVEQIKQNFQKSSKQIEQQLGVSIMLACIIRKTDKQDNIVELYDSQSNLISSHQTNDVAEKLMQACQNQIIMKNAAFTFVLCVQPSMVKDWSHYKYGLSILSASFICVDLYLDVINKRVGTTTIGGFSELLIMDILKQNDILPIVIQAFGVEASNQKKIDAVYNIN